MDVEVGNRGRCAEAVDADGEPFTTGVTLPAEGARSLDRDDQRVIGEQVGAVGGILFVEQLCADHRDNVSADPCGFELGGALQRDLDFRAAGKDHDLARIGFS